MLKKTESKSPRATKTIKGKPLLLSKYEVYDSKKVIFFKAQEVSWIKNLSY